MKIEIRKAASPDIDFIAALEKDCFSLPESRADFEKMLASKDKLLLVATEGERLLGYICAYTVCRESDILTIAVLPSERKRGVGRLLLSALEKELSKVSDALFLEVREGNESARGLYLSAGFSEIGIRKNYYEKPRENAILYKKELNLCTF